MNAGKLIVVIAVGVVALGVLSMYSGRKAASAKPPHAGPPPNAPFVTESPEVVIATGAPSRNPRAKPIDYTGMWVPNEGWDGVVEEITSETEGPALRLRRITTSMLGGECWIVALVDEDHGINKGESVHVQGKIRSVKIQLAQSIIINSIVLEEARVVSKP